MEAWGCHELSHEMWRKKAKTKECRAQRGRKWILATLAEFFDTAMPENAFSFMQVGEFLYCLSQLPLVFYCFTRRSVQFSSIQLLSHVLRFATPRTAASKASLSISNSQSLLKLMSIESVIPSNHLILWHPLLLPHSIFPCIRIFSHESVLCISGQSIRVSASTWIFQLQWIFRTDLL